MARSDSESGTEIIEKEKVRIKHPKMYKVILLNDDYTSMDFVVSVLETIFGKNPSEAVQIMLSVHQRGSGLCGMYPKQIAEAKILMVHTRAKQEGYPLKCMMEEV